MRLRSSLAQPFLWVLGVLVWAVGLARPYVGRITIDDAYITYRYAENLAAHGRLVYDLAGDRAFATTAPGYAVLLSIFHLLGATIPLSASVLGALALLVAAWSLSDLLREYPFPVGFLAGTFLVAFPLPWLVLGMEGLPSLALALLGFALSRRKHDTAAALAFAGATFLRFDAVAAVAAWGLYLLARRRWGSLVPFAVYIVALLLPYGAMMGLLGVPLPSTLGSKQAQIALGITGFFTDTTWPSGIVVLAQALWQQSPFYAATSLFSLVSVIALIAAVIRRQAQRERWQSAPAEPLLLVLWATAHATLYVISGVTPYLWYYLPLVPLISALTVTGIYALLSSLTRLLTRFRLAPIESGLLGEARRRFSLRFTYGYPFATPFQGVQRRLERTPQASDLQISDAWGSRLYLEGRQLLLFIICFVVAVLGPVTSHRRIQAHLDNPVETSQPTPESKLLPEAKAIPYREAGQWLAANTGPEATVGVTEVGVLGYYTQRSMIDFLGLLDENVARALTRQDLAWALYNRQPDYLVLSEVNPIFGFDVYRDRWFQGTYKRVHQVPHNGFWGGDLTLYRRQTPAPPEIGARSELPVEAEPLAFRFEETLELVGFSAPTAPWKPGEPASLTLYWRVLQTPVQDYTLFAHLWDESGRLISSRDSLPLLGERPMTEWQPGELLADYVPLGLPPMPLAPTTLHFGVGFYDPATGERLPAFGLEGVPIEHQEPLFGQRDLLPAAPPLVLSTSAYGGTARLVLSEYEVASDGLTRGEATALWLDFAACDCPADVTIELWDPDGQRIVAQHTETLVAPGRLEVPLEPGVGEPPYRVEVRLRATQNGIPFFWEDDAGHPLSDWVLLTPLFIGGP